MRIFRLLLIAGLLLMPAAASGGDGGVDLSAVTLRDAAGESVVLGDLVAGPTIIHFWATWCAPCLEELPELDRFARDVEPGRLVVVSVDTADYGRIEDYLADLDVELKSFQQIQGNVGSVFAILGYPSTVVVDETGEVVFQRQGAVDWGDAEIAREIGALIAQ